MIMDHLIAFVVLIVPECTNIKKHMASFEFMGRGDIEIKIENGPIYYILIN